MPRARGIFRLLAVVVFAATICLHGITLEDLEKCTGQDAVKEVGVSRRVTVRRAQAPEVGNREDRAVRPVRVRLGQPRKVRSDALLASHGALWMKLVAFTPRNARVRTGYIKSHIH